jgi:hypothetical protein
MHLYVAPDTFRRLGLRRHLRRGRLGKKHAIRQRSFCSTAVATTVPAGVTQMAGGPMPVASGTTRSCGAASGLNGCAKRTSLRPCSYTREATAMPAFVAPAAAGKSCEEWVGDAHSIPAKRRRGPDVDITPRMLPVAIQKYKTGRGTNIEWDATGCCGTVGKKLRVDQRRPVVHDVPT